MTRRGGGGGGDDYSRETIISNISIKEGGVINRGTAVIRGNTVSLIMMITMMMMIMFVMIKIVKEARGKSLIIKAY